MKATIQFECGETTCASEPGKFCRFLRTELCGTKWMCNAFEEPLREDLEDGWLQRCSQCLAECKGEPT